MTEPWQMDWTGNPAEPWNMKWNTAKELAEGALADGFPTGQDRGIVPTMKRVSGGLANQIIAGVQQTSPVTHTLAGEQRYGPSLGPVYELDSGEPSYRDTAGAHPLDPNKHVILVGPDGNLRAYNRSPATDTGAMVSLGHLVGMGAIASPLASGAQLPRELGQMARTVGQFERQNIPPTLASASSNRGANILHNMLKDFWPSASVVEGADIAQLRAGLNTATELAGKYGPGRAPLDAGAALKRGAESFINKPSPGLTGSEILLSPTRAVGFGTKAEAAYAKVDQFVSAEAPVKLASTLSAFNRLGERFNLQALAQQFEDPKLKTLADILRKSNSGVISWNDARNLRTELGGLMKKPEAVTGINEAQLKSLYAGLSSDIEAAALAAGGAPALNAWKRATQYYSAGLKRINNGLSQILKPTTSDEGAFSLLMKTTAAGRATENAKRLESIRRSMPDEEWGEVASTVIQQLGKPAASVVDVTGKAPEFSAATFVTNYEKLSDQAKASLFGGSGRENLRMALDEFVQVMSRIRNTERVSNRSLTASGVNVLGTGAALMTAPVRAGIALMGARMVAKGMTNPGFVRWLSGLAQVKTPAEFVTRVNRLSQLARLDPALADVAATFQSALGGASDQNVGQSR